MFDVIAYLEARGIPYSTGKNVSGGWVGIQCVYPLCDDTSNHLGVNLNTGVHSCWKCGRKGGPERLVELIDRVDWAHAEEIVKRFDTILPEHVPAQPRGEFMLPKFATPHPMGPHEQYIRRRGYDSIELINKYRLCFTGPVAWVQTPRGRITYQWRIIIPIFIDGSIVNFIARDITEVSTQKYKMGPDDIAICRGGDCVYNIDNVRDVVMCVEGPFDAWRLGDGAVAMLGTVFTESQLSLIASKRPKRAFIVYDIGAERIAKELGLRLARLVPNTEYVWLSEGDPDTANPNDLAYLKSLLK